MYRILKISTLSIFFSFLTLQVSAENDKTFSDTIHLSNDTNFTGFDYLDSAALASDVFINGENHTYMTSNKKLWVKMIKYLHKNAGVRNIVLEYGFAAGYLVNEYIQTGDTQLFALLEKYSFPQHSEAYKELMEFNMTLDSNEKIRIAGIDLERGYRTAVKALCYLLPDSFELHDSIALDVESLQGLCSYNDNVVYNEELTTYRDDYSTKSTMLRVIKNFRAHEDKYKELLGDNFATFRKIMLGIEDLYDWYELGMEDAVQDYVYREMYLFMRFKEEKMEHEGKFFGQFGRCHSAHGLQEETGCNWFEFRSLVNRIETWNYNGSRLKVFTTGIMYANDEYDIKGWEHVDEVLDSLFVTFEPDRVAFYDFKKDSVLNEQLSGMFDLMVLCTYGQDRNYPGVAAYQDYYGLYESSGRGYLLGFAGTQQMKLKRLAAVMDLNSSKTLETWGIEVSGMDIMGFGGGMIFYSALQQKDQISDSMTARLSGYGVSAYNSYDFLSGSKALDLEFRYGFGFSQLKLQYEETYTESSVDQGRIGDRRVIVYKNPGIFFDAGGSFRLNLSFFTMSVSGGFQNDFSDSSWLVDKKRLEGSPRTAMSGWYTRYNIGFNF